MQDSKSLDQHELEGTRRDDRHTSDLSLPLVEAKVPEHFTPEQMEIWNRLVGELEPDIVDLALLETAVMAISRVKEASKRINEDGMTLIGTNGLIYAHPMINVERQFSTLALKALNDLRAKFGKKNAQRKGESLLRQSPRQLAKAGK